MKPMTLAEKMNPVEPTHNTSYYFKQDTIKFAQAISANEEHMFSLEEREDKPDLIMGTAYASPNTSLTKVIIADLLFSRPVQSPFAYPEAYFVQKSNSSAHESFHSLLKASWFQGFINTNNCKIEAVYDGDYSIAYTFHSIEEGLYRRYKCTSRELGTDFGIEVIVPYSKNHTDVVLSIVERNPGEKKPKINDRMKYETLDYFGSLLPQGWVKIGYGFAETKEGPEWLAKVIKDGVATYLEVPVIPGSNHESEIERYKKDYL